VRALLASRAGVFSLISLTPVLFAAILLHPAGAAPGPSGVSEEVPKVDYQLDYKPELNITAPFTLSLSVYSDDLNLSHFTVRFYMNCTLPGITGGGIFSTEVMGEGGQAKIILHRPFLPFNFSFYLVVVAEGVEVRIPSLSELPVSFLGGVVDKDGDGMDDRWEAVYGLDPLWAGDSEADPDGDGLGAGEEYLALTSPTQPDTDSDGLDDGWEVREGTCPFLEDAEADYDGDGATNYQEYIFQTDPRNAESVPDLAPTTPWYYVVAIVAVVLILLIYFVAQMVVNRREEEILTGRERDNESEDPG